MNNQPLPLPASDLPPAAEPARETHTGTPHYGDFGHPADPNTPHVCRESIYDGSNDNPDEFSGFRSKHAAHYCLTDARAAPAGQRGHVAQNQATGASRAAQGQDDAAERAAYTLDDLR